MKFVYFLFIVLTGIFSHLFSAANSPSTLVLFEESMGKCKTLSKEDTLRYNTAKALYEKAVFTDSPEKPHVKIPKIIHQIWIGPKLPPSYLFHFQKNIQALHPDWEYHLWSEKNLEPLCLPNQDLVEDSDNFGIKADIIRCDILEHFGGVFLDADIDLRSILIALHEQYDFYAGLEQPRPFPGTTNQLWVGVAIVGAAPGHPILRAWQKEIRKGWKEQQSTSHVENAFQHTFYLFTHSVFRNIGQKGFTDILLPCSYFFPFASGESKRDPSLIKKETIAVHHWKGSWVPTPEEQTQTLFRLLQEQKKNLYRGELEDNIDKNPSLIKTVPFTDDDRGTDGFNCSNWHRICWTCYSCMFS